MIISILFVSVVLCLFLWRDTRKSPFYPPGPRWLPFIGVLPLVQKLHNIYKFYHLIWYHLYQVYGPIVGLRVGNDRLIIVSGRKAIKEFYANDAFNGRPDGFFYRIRSFNKQLGVVFSDGYAWDVQRKFSVKILRQMGMGRSIMIQHVEKEAAEMVRYFRECSKSGNSLDMQHAFDVSVLNTLWALVAGHRFQLEDKRLQKLLFMIHECFRVIDMTGGILNLLPCVRHFAPDMSGYRPLLNAHKPLWSFLKEVVSETKAKLNGAETTSFIGSYLKEIEISKDTINNTFTEEQLLATCLDLFQAGTETTSNTLSFGLIYMVHNGTIQAKVRYELDRVIGHDRLPTLNDRSDLPYVEATLCEIQRMANVAPLGIVHRSLETVKFGDYIIPKNAIMLVSLYSLNMDTEYWKDPMVFRPERFLDDEGKLIQHIDQFLPFGLGKRRCMGENLAKSTLFLFFATFMHSFEFQVSPGNVMPSIDGYDGITLSPKPFKLLITPRC